MAMSASAAKPGIIYYNEHNVLSVKHENQTTGEFFDSSSCGSYHCYAIKNGEVYSIGRGYEGQLGAFDREEKAGWEKSFPELKSSVEWVKANDHGGCFKTSDEKHYQTGKIKDSTWVEGEYLRPVILYKWTEVDGCKEVEKGNRI